MGVRAQVEDQLKERLSPSLRRRIVRVRLRLRGVTAIQRETPNFLVIGTERGGTSSLYKYLGRHPQIAPSLRKETEYFNRHFDRGMPWYLAHFPLKWRRWGARAVGSQLLSFEATPTYLQEPRVPERVAVAIPEAKFVVLLRDPIARALSAWRHLCELGFESLSFEEAIQAEEERTAKEFERMMAEPYYFSRPYQRFTYLDRGRYAEQLERWFSLFPKERFLILESELFYEDTARIYEEIIGFLGLRPWTPGEFKMYSSATSSDPSHVADALPPAIRSQLMEYYRPHNERLTQVLGRSFSWS